MNEDMKDDHIISRAALSRRMIENTLALLSTRFDTTPTSGITLIIEAIQNSYIDPLIDQIEFARAETLNLNVKLESLNRAMIEMDKELKLRMDALERRESSDYPSKDKIDSGM